MRYACTLRSDQALFQRLRLFHSFSPLPGTDEMVLGTRISPDTVDVENIESENGDFVANFKILAFQKRMRVSHTIGLEFIAKGKILLCWLAYIYLMTPYCVLGRMWCLSFSITHNSDWFVMLSISDRSPATWVDSHIIIEEPPQSSVISAPH